VGKAVCVVAEVRAPADATRRGTRRPTVNVHAGRRRYHAPSRFGHVLHVITCQRHEAYANNNSTNAADPHRRTTVADAAVLYRRTSELRETNPP